MCTLNLRKFLSFLYEINYLDNTNSGDYNGR